MKKIYAKVYKKEGIDRANFIDQWNDFQFQGFTKNVDGGLGECKLILARNFDSYDEFRSVVLGNIVELIVFDEDVTDETFSTPAGGGKRVYQGYISAYSPMMDGGEERVEITLLGQVTRLAMAVYRNGSTTTFSHSASAVDTIFKSIINLYRSNVGTELGYTSDSIGTTAQVMTYTFRGRSYLEAIQKTRELAPSGWRWYLDENNITHFRAVPTEATHTLILGRHFTRVDVRKTIETTRNTLYLTDGGGTNYKRYQDANSFADFGERGEFIVDQKFDNTATMDNFAEKWLNEHKDSQLEIEIDVVDNNENGKGYNIETINPMDTCKIVGFPVALAETFLENMLVTNVHYMLDKVRVRLEPVKKQISGDLIKLRGNVDDIQKANLPSSYT